MLCTICKSNHRKDIETAIKNNTQRIEIFNKYAPLLNYLSTPNSFYVLLHRHWKHRKREDKTQVSIEGGTGTIAINSLVDRVRQIYGEKLNTMTPEELMKEIKLRDVYQGERILIEARKVKMQQEAMETMMAKLFGPKLIDGEEVQEGEIVSGDRPKQIAPVQPDNT